MATTGEVARWLLEELERGGELTQAAAAGIRARFGPGLTDGERLPQGLRKAFRRHAVGRVVWVPSMNGWHWRNQYDPPASRRAGG